MSGRLAICAAALLPALVFYGCAVPRMLLPRSDIEPRELGDPALDRRILIASRDTDFKIEVARMIAESFAGEPAYMRFTGIEMLKDEDPEDYDAVVVMTSCIAWGIEAKVDDFLSKHGDSGNIVLLVTSGDGKWRPEPEGRRFDAIATASVKADAGKAAAEVLAAVRERLTEGGD